MGVPLPWRGLSLVAAFWAGLLGAAQVEVMSEDRLAFLTYPSREAPLQIGEAACIFRQGQRIACGYVDAANESAARVLVTSSAGVPIELGDPVERAEHTANVFAAYVSRNSYFITHESNRRWIIGDTACLARGAMVFACGIVTATDDLQAELKLYENGNLQVQPGDEVQRTGGRTQVLAVDAYDLLLGPTAQPWKLGQSIALFRQGNGIAMAQISRVDETGTVARILGGSEMPVAGDQALPLSRIPTRETAQVPETVTATAIQPPPKPKEPGDTLVSVGMFTFIESLRYLRIERRFGERTRVGAVSYLLGGDKPTGTLSGFGTVVTVGYAPFSGLFQGVHLQGGLGLMKMEFDGTNPETVNRLALSLGAYWRVYWESGFNLAAGFSQILTLGRASAQLPSSLPTVALELGVQF